MLAHARRLYGAVAERIHRATRFGRNTAVVQAFEVSAEAPQPAAIDAVGWRRFFDSTREDWRCGARVESWDLDLRWRDISPTQRAGTTDVLVLQPTLELGYRWRIADSAWFVDLTASLGVELNLDTTGEDVGEGAIGLIGMSLVRAL